MKNGFSIKAVILIIVITSLITSLTTGLILYNNTNLLLGSTVELTDDANLKEFIRIYNDLNKDYYDKIDRKGMIEEAISAMLDYLHEDYSTYLNKNQTTELENKLNGEYNGIGIYFTGKKIVQVLEDTPASNAGLIAGDEIVSINDISTDGKTNSEILGLISKDKENTITIKRNDELISYNIKTSQINTPLTNTIININDKNIGYIKVSAFTNKVGEEFKKTLLKLEGQGIDSLVIDMRDNLGGYLKGASEIANLFLEKDKIIYSLDSKDGISNYKDDTDESRTYQVVILINKNTASASEVLTAALKDSYNAIIVGEKSYGKGRVQEAKTLEDGTMVKYTTAKWLTPLGNCIDEIGISPDYVVEMTKNENGEIVDNQLDKAVEILSYTSSSIIEE